MKTFAARTVKEWRDWLRRHHQSESEVWLVFYKQHTGQTSIPYEDSVDEALCYGWIDSLIKRLDDSRYARTFTPRNKDSRWSTANRRRYKRLKASGRLKAGGIKRPPGNRSGDAPLPVASKVPRYVRAELKKHPVALRNFEKLPPSHQRRYVGWIDSAKLLDTKARRLGEAIRMLSTGNRLGLK